MKIFIYALSGILLTALQTTLAYYNVDIFGASPNLVLAFVVCVALLEKPVYAGTAGLLCGIVVDLMTSQRFGFNSLIFMYSAIVISLLKSKYLVPGSFVSSMFAFFAALVHGTLHYFFFVFLWADVSFFPTILRVVLPASVYTAAVAFIFYPIFRKVGKRQ